MHGDKDSLHKEPTGKKTVLFSNLTLTKEQDGKES
jgi:hypothetical protein